MEIGQLGEANLTTSPVLSEQLVEAPEHLAGGGLGHFFIFAVTSFGIFISFLPKI